MVEYGPVGTNQKMDGSTQLLELFYADAGLQIDVDPETIHCNYSDALAASTNAERIAAVEELLEERRKTCLT